jgi:hypothetical protein
MGELSFLVPLTKGVMEELQKEVEGFKIQVVAGDTKVVWDKKNKEEVATAEATFDRLTKKGFAAFSVDEDGTKDEKIKKFDPTLQKIILVPPMAGG